MEPCALQQQLALGQVSHHLQLLWNLAMSSAWLAGVTALTQVTSLSLLLCSQSKASHKQPKAVVS